MFTGNINVISSPSGFKRSLICFAHAGLLSGSIAQKNLQNTTQAWDPKDQNFTPIKDNTETSIFKKTYV